MYIVTRNFEIISKCYTLNLDFSIHLKIKIIFSNKN